MKSQVIRLTELAELVYYDASAKCSAKNFNLPEERDLDVLRSRVKDEGMSFFTLTMPTLGADLETSLALGKIDPLCFRSFKKYKKAPAFLRGFFDLIFDSGTGDLKDDPTTEAIEGIRQMAYLYKKLKLPCTPNRVNKAIQGFIQCEQDLKEALVQTDVDHFDRISSILWGNVLPGKVTLEDVVPKHGPGATQEGIHGNAKYVHKRWHDRLEPFFPILSTAFSSESAADGSTFKNLTVICEDAEEPVRVITVPKTLKGPRIIAIEPVCMQYTQQGLSGVLTKALETHPLTAGHINFSDQSINRQLALSASLDEKFATLDLSSASDRVPRELALRMFDSVPDFRDAIDACRTRRAMLPEGDVIPLKKFASMGSALCFPIEAMYFYTICVKALLDKHKLPVSYPAIKYVARYIYVYGDDIIVPTDCADTTVATLQKYYCKVNYAKSFWSGKFRESCGLDAFNGEEVTPTYVRNLCPDSRQQASELVSWIASSNLFYQKGYWRTSDYMHKACSKQLGVLPVVGNKSAGLGILSYQCSDSILADEYLATESLERTGSKFQIIRNVVRQNGITGHQSEAYWHAFRKRKRKVRWNANLQRLEVKTWCAVTGRRKDDIDGYPALMKTLLKLVRKQDEDQVSDEADHLSKTARYGSVTLKSRWVLPY